MMYKFNLRYIAIAISYLLLAACSKKQADEVKPDDPVEPGNPPVAVTYTGFVGPLFQSKCASCHAPGRAQAAIWSFNGYASVTANSARIKDVVLVRKTMPIGTSISAADLQSLQEWFDKGSPE